MKLYMIEAGPHTERIDLLVEFHIDRMTRVGRDYIHWYKDHIRCNIVEW